MKKGHFYTATPKEGACFYTTTHNEGTFSHYNSQSRDIFTPIQLTEEGHFHTATHREWLFPGGPNNGGSDNSDGQTDSLGEEDPLGQLLGVGVGVGFVLQQLLREQLHHVIVHPPARSHPRYTSGQWHTVTHVTL